MKILVVYMTLTGNTEKIAQAIFNEVSASHDAQLKKIDQVPPETMDEYDLVIVGAPIHAGGLAADAQKFLASLSASTSRRLMGFMTHASPAYEKEGFAKGLGQFEEVCGEKKIEYYGCFDCRGRLDPNIQPAVQKARNIPDDEWAERMAKTDRHPSAEDEENARAFVRDVLSRL
jgi:flavodoxin